MRALVSRRTAFVAITCALASVSGCATAPKPIPSVSIALEQLERWQARGRIGVSGPGGGGSGSFEWQQHADVANIQIRGPVGIGSVRLQVRGDASNPQLQLETGDGAMLESDAAWTELEARLGADLPAGNLRYWLLGLAAPGAHEWLPANDGGEVSLEQQGWRIDYQRYSADAGAKVPTRLRATSGDARVRIVVDRWQLGE